MKNRKLAGKLSAAILTFALVGGVLTPFADVHAEGEAPSTETVAPAAENTAAEPTAPATESTAAENAAPAAGNAGAEAAAPADNTTAAEPAASEENTNVVDLPADLLVGEETEHDKVYETTKDAEIAFTGALYVSKVKEQMKEVEEEMKKRGVVETMYPEIQLSPISEEFSAVLTLPGEMEFVNPQGHMIENENEKTAFEVTSVTVVENTVTVKMSLKGMAGITTYQQLHDAVMGSPDVLKVVVTGAKFKASAAANTNYTVLGVVDGHMKTTATLYSQSIPFNFKWKSVQKPEGKDVVASDDKTVQFTLKYVEGEPTPGPEPGITPNTPDPKKPAPEAKPTVKKTEAVKTTETPKTGDRSHLPLYGGLAVVAILVVGGVIIVKIKRK